MTPPSHDRMTDILNELKDVKAALGRLDSTVAVTSAFIGKYETFEPRIRNMEVELSRIAGERSVAGKGANWVLGIVASTIVSAIGLALGYLFMRGR